MELEVAGVEEDAGRRGGAGRWAAPARRRGVRWPRELGGVAGRSRPVKVAARRSKKQAAAARAPGGAWGDGPGGPDPGSPGRGGGDGAGCHVAAREWLAAACPALADNVQPRGWSGARV